MCAVRTIRPEKCDIFAQHYQCQPITKNFKNTPNIFLTFRNHVKIFLSQNIMHNFKSAVYRKNLSIRTDRTDKTVKTLIRLLSVRSSLSRVFTVCHSICFVYTSYCNENPNCSILGYFQYLFQVFQFLEVST